MNKPDSSDGQLERAIILERYKYVMTQKQLLNAATFKIIAMYQTVVTLIISAIGAILYAGRDGGVDPSARSAALVWLIFGVTVMSAFSLAGIFCGLAAWLKYRQDERALEIEAGRPQRELPTWKDALRWYETYFAILMVTVPILAAIFVYCGVN
jgi:hypothetical protein